MQEKTKRKHRQGSWKFTVLLTLLIILVAAISSPFIYSSFAPRPYATQAWEHPLVICTTDWYQLPLEADFERLFSSNFNELKLDLSLVSIDRAGSRGPCADGNDYNELSFRFLAEAELLQNPEELGDMVAELIPIVAAAGQENLSVVNFAFWHLELELRGWRLNFVEAQRALAAGLRGADLWLIGQ